MSEDSQVRIGDRRLWERVLYMLFCAVVYGVAELVVAVLAIFQVVCVALTGSINDRAQQLGRNVGSYIFQLIQFATFNDERVPFPFSDWPDEEPGQSPWLRAERPAQEAERREAPARTTTDAASAEGDDDDPVGDHPVHDGRVDDETPRDDPLR